MVHSYIQKTIPRFLKDQELIISFLIIFACLFLCNVFPVDSGSLIQLLTKNIFFLVVIPALYVKIILKKNLSDFGLNIKNKKVGLTLGIIIFLALLLVYYVLFNYTSLEKKYLLPKNITGQFAFFLVYELVIMNILLFSQEFFYRGFMLNLLLKKFGFWAIAIQSTVFILVSIFSNSFFWQFSIPIVLSVSNGYLAAKSKSFLFSYIVSLLFIIIANSYIIYSVNIHN